MNKPRSVLFAVAIASALLLVGGAEGGTKIDGFTKHFKDSLFEITAQRLFSVEMRIKGHDLVMGTNSVDIIVHDSFDKDVAGATVTLELMMPEAVKGSEASPPVVEKGGGLYTAEFVLPLAGHWQLKVTVKRGGTEDSAVFDFPSVASGWQ